MNAALTTDSSLDEQIIALDPSRDSGMYPIGKLEAHQRNIRHKAISIFVFHKDQLLLQKRADNKYHSGGLWANTVCTHPRWQENSDACAARRLQEELGWTVPLRHFGQIDYAAQVGTLFENEQVQCYFGKMHDLIDVSRFNHDEVAAVEWLSIPSILQRIEHQPETFTEWLKIYLSEHHTLIAEQLRDPVDLPTSSG